MGSVFGGDTGLTRLVDAALGGQAGWLIGMALVGGIGVAVATRLRRSDPRTGFIIAAGGAFATCAVVFSYAKGIFHPYYVSMLAPFTAVLVGATVGTVLQAAAPRRGSSARWRCSPGWLTEMMVINRGAADVDGLIPLAIVAAVGGAAVLVAQGADEGPRRRAGGRARRAADRAGVVVGADARPRDEHDVPRGRPVVAGRLRRRRPGGRWRGAAASAAARAAAAGRLPTQAAPARRERPGPAPGRVLDAGPGSRRRRRRRGGGGMFGGNTNLTEALAYAKAHGGGTIGVSSSRARPRRSSSTARRSPASAGSPAASRRSPRSGWPRRSGTGGSATS